MSIELTGNWKKGLAFDVHTLSSTYLGPNEYCHEQWDTVRSEMGELVYQLKYRQNLDTIPKILQLLDKIKGLDKLDYFIPIPSSNKTRGFHPVIAISKALGKKQNVPVLDDLLISVSNNEQLKDINSTDERTKILKQNLEFTARYDIRKKNVLLIDDLYRSGATLTAATALLYNKGQAANVFVLTMTKTRSKK